MVVNTLEYGSLAAAGGLEVEVLTKIMGGFAGASVAATVSDNKQAMINSVADTLYANMRDGQYHNPMMFQP